MALLQVIVVSTREGRVGGAVAEWFVALARGHAGFDVEVIDLKSVNLPLVDEPHHPRFHRYEHAHTKAWSETIARGDAYVFVTPEYNYSVAPSLVNALDYLFVEWRYKAAAFVSYGGISGGTRSVQVAKGILTTLRMMPIPEAVTIPFVQQSMKDGIFEGSDKHAGAVKPMLDELHRWTTALAPLRAGPPA